ncbi:metallophosphoesterase [Hymenobacter properus]|uniref:Metallophosphoesterase n=1 Tax=Hymenobacter properus TaxID=2791026 RepID=A0A931BHT0_9BACT|nr:metallophosphoesterase [Hymenobacter properus]MBF9140448.1 metallophosphoesterase [Hymenobacter properus]MBR7719255.1 metallophosphoesterase [Microvirga sp. SRT04]
MYDLIGDIHGHAAELRQLLAKLDYAPDAAGVYRHNGGRQVIFLGDFIDRGPAIRETLLIVRGMVDGGAALAVMGNHEFNALNFWTFDPSGGHLRPHLPHHILQHIETVRAFNGKELFAEWRDYLAWFMRLPLFLELPGLRVVHACWDARYIAQLRQWLPHDRLTPEFLLRASRKGSAELNAVEITLKGHETDLPGDHHFFDKDGHRRTKMRTAWWRDPTSATYDDYFLEPIEALAGQPVDVAALPSPAYYQDETPVFFGHYWLRGEPRLLTPHSVCLDYSVAKGGELVAYRWQGEQELTPAGLVRV